MDAYTLIWPSDFDDYAWEVESKGWFAGVELEVAGKRLTPTFYDPTRLAQDIAEEISTTGCAVHACIIVLDRVCRNSIESAIQSLARSGELARLAAGSGG